MAIGAVLDTVALASVTQSSPASMGGNSNLCVRGLSTRAFGYPLTPRGAQLLYIVCFNGKHCSQVFIYYDSAYRRTFLMEEFCSKSSNDRRANKEDDFAVIKNP